MSGQAKRSRVKATERHRRAVARELARLEVTGHDTKQASRLTAECADALLNGKCFDVYAAREHARSLIAISDKDRASTAISGLDMYSGRLGQRILDMLEGQPSECRYHLCRDGFELESPALLLPGEMPQHAFTGRDCPSCRGTVRNLQGKLPPLEWSPAVRRKHKDSVDARQGETRRSWIEDIEVPILTALYTDLNRAWCPPNHRGEWDPPQGFKKLAEVERRLKTGLRPLPSDCRCGRNRTRTVPRGEHRGHVGDPHRWCPQSTWAQRDVRLPQSGSPTANTPPGWTWDMMPRWRRGELEHARQRREREARSRIELLEAPSLETSRGSDRFPATHRARFRAIGADAYRYFRDCMGERRAVDLRRLGLTGLPEGEWIVGGFQTRADTMITEVIITRLVPMGMREQHQHGDLADD